MITLLRVCMSFKMLLLKVRRPFNKFLEPVFLIYFPFGVSSATFLVKRCMEDFFYRIGLFSGFYRFGQRKGVV